MANIASAKKRVLVSEKKQLQNKILVSKYKTLLKKYNAAIATGNVELSTSLFPKTVGFIDSLSKKGIIHKNNADRRKANASKKLFVLKNKSSQSTQTATV